jgi:hypothetical protein
VKGSRNTVSTNSGQRDLESRAIELLPCIPVFRQRNMSMGWRAVRLRVLYLAQINPYLTPLSDGEQHLPSAGCPCSRHAIASVADPSIHEASRVDNDSMGEGKN